MIKTGKRKKNAVLYLQSTVHMTEVGHTPVKDKSDLLHGSFLAQKNYEYFIATAFIACWKLFL